LIEAPSVAELTRLRYLVPAKIFAPVRPDLSGIRVERGDYVESQLAKPVDTTQLRGDIVEHWYRLGERRRTVCLTVNVAHSVHIEMSFGAPARWPSTLTGRHRSTSANAF
jgi:DNA repair protein RadD